MKISRVVKTITCIGCGEGSAWRGVDLSFKKIQVPVLGSTERVTEYRHSNQAVCDAIKKTRRSTADRLKDTGLVAP